MAFVAARSSAGTHRQVNEDACCIEVASTALGEVLMAVVCDGVGGLSKGNVASSTVIDRFARWFEGELPLLMEGMAEAGRFDFGLVKAVWDALLQGQNELIRSHGVQVGARLGTTFTGIIACGGHYLLGHVGDCRAYQMSRASFAQVTQDQTLIAKRLAAGEITAEEAARAPKNVILQAVGSQRTLSPVFSEGTLAADELVVICCDGAYHKAENEGIRQIFQGIDYRDEAALQQACDTLLQVDMDYGEKDNLTVVAVAGALAGPGEEPLEAPTPAAPAHAAPVPQAVSALDEDDAPTMVEPDEGLPGEDLDEDDAPTMIADDDEDDAPTMVADEEPAGEDDAPTMVADDEPDGEDDAPTMVADEEPAGEDDLPTMVASDEGGDA